MTVTITATLDSPREELIAVAQFILERTGFVAPPAVMPPMPELKDLELSQGLTDPLVQRGERIGSWTGDAPQSTFTETIQNGISVDAAGVPWDSRIHSGSRAKTTDGLWRQRRNLDPAVLQQVTDELKGMMATPASVEVPAASVGVPSASVGVPPPPFVPPVAVPPPPPSIILPPVSDGVATTASTSNATPLDLIRAVTAGIRDRVFTRSEVDEACKSVGLDGLMLVTGRPDLVDAIANKIGVAL